MKTLSLVLSTLIATAALSACGGEGRETTLPYKWNKSPQTVVLSHGEGGGYMHPFWAFRAHLYGSPFVRLMGDGTLYSGTGGEIKTIKLSESEMQTFLEALRPEVFADFKEQYVEASLSLADAGHTDIAVNVESVGSFKTTVYAYGYSRDKGMLPKSLVSAVNAIDELAARAKAIYQPQRILIAAQELTGSDQLTSADKWTHGGDLALANPYDVKTAIAIDGPKVLNALLARLSVEPDFQHRDNDVFEQDGKQYWVTYTIALPAPQ